MPINATISHGTSHNSPLIALLLINKNSIITVQNSICVCAMDNSLPPFASITHIKSDTAYSLRELAAALQRLCTVKK